MNVNCVNDVLTMGMVCLGVIVSLDSSQTPQVVIVEVCRQAL